MRITHDLIAHQVLSDRHRRALATRLEYDERRPLEVRVVFHTDRRDAVSWVLPRELLADGLGRPCGDGDVQLRPVVHGDRHLLSVLLTGEDGVALVEVPAAEIGAFVLQTLRLVPRGREPRTPALDSLGARLQREAPDHHRIAAATRGFEGAVRQNLNR